MIDFNFDSNHSTTSFAGKVRAASANVKPFRNYGAVRRVLLQHATENTKGNQPHFVFTSSVEFCAAYTALTGIPLPRMLGCEHSFLGIILDDRLVLNFEMAPGNGLSVVLALGEEQMLPGF